VATKDKAPARTRGAGIHGIETRSIDWIPDTERHGKVWHQAPLWFLGNFQYFTIPIGFIGPAFGLSLAWTIVAARRGSWWAPCSWPSTRPKDPRSGCRR
jgi:hypothetical protein